MGHKPAFSISSTNNNNKDTASPFWATDIAPLQYRLFKYGKITWKWLKLGLLIFFFTMGLYGCFQFMGDPTLKTSNYLGDGMEFGLAYGTTGDYYYDVVGSLNPGYFTFTNFSFNYGPFFAFFIYPFAWLCIWLMWATRGMPGGINSLLCIFIVLLIIRGATLFISLRASIQTEKMMEIRSQTADINAKYKGLKDLASMQQKRIEIQALQKKHHVKPFAQFEQIMVTLPVYMIIYRLVTIVRPIKSTNLFGIWNFASSPLTEIFNNLANGGWVYIFFLLILIPFHAFSSIFPRILSKKRNKNITATRDKGKKALRLEKIMQLVSIGFIVLIVINSPTGVGVYYFLSSIISIAQTALIHYLLVRDKAKHGTLEIKLQKLGLE